MKELPTQLHNAMIDGLTMLLTLTSERFAGCRYCGRDCANLEPCIGARSGVGRSARCTAISDGLYGAGK